MFSDILKPPFLAIYQDHGLDNIQSFRARTLDGLNSGAAGGGHIIDDCHPLTRLNIAFDPANNPVVFAGFTNRKGINGFSF